MVPLNKGWSKELEELTDVEPRCISRRPPEGYLAE
jgi:hypothetical protein